MKRLLFILFCASLPVHAQDDPLEDHFIPPEVIMRHQGELGITSAQREQIKEQVRNAQMKFTELQWDIQAEIEALTTLLEDRAAAEGPVLEQLDRVLAVEAAIKRTQVSMLIALRRALTDEQLEQARGFAGGGFGLGTVEREIRREAERAARKARAQARKAAIQEERALKESLNQLRQAQESQPED